MPSSVRYNITRRQADTLPPLLLRYFTGYRQVTFTMRFACCGYATSCRRHDGADIMMIDAAMPAALITLPAFNAAWHYGQRKMI